MNTIELVPYKTTTKTEIKKYHIVSDDKIVKCNICNVYAPFGRQTEKTHKASYVLHQHRLNINFSEDDLKKGSESYEMLTKNIRDFEKFFMEFDELKGFELISNVINRPKYGIIIRFHLKTLHDKTTTPLIQIINSKTENVEWIQFDNNKQFNCDFHPDCLWIDEKNKKFGVSFVIDKVTQYIN